MCWQSSPLLFENELLALHSKLFVRTLSSLLPRSLQRAFLSSLFLIDKCGKHARPLCRRWLHWTDQLPVVSLERCVRPGSLHDVGRLCRNLGQSSRHAATQSVGHKRSPAMTGGSVNLDLRLGVEQLTLASAFVSTPGRGWCVVDGNMSLLWLRPLYHDQRKG